jgi:hypothetical protein
MPLSWSRAALAALGTVLLGRCAAPNIDYYAPPPGLTPDRGVSLLGSKDSKFFLQSSEYRLVWAVDGKPVKDSADRWDQPLLITAGEPHKLGLAYGWGAVAGSVAVEFTGEPGTTVVVEGQNVDPDTEALLWLQNATTGQILGEKLPVRLAYRNDPTLAIMSSMPPSNVIVIKAISR